jgi:hypothetical protein
MIQEQLRKQSAPTARLFLLYQSIWHLWLGRNAKIFNDERQSFFLDLALAEMSFLLTSVISALPPGECNTRIKKARDEVDR